MALLKLIKTLYRTCHPQRMLKMKASRFPENGCCVSSILLNCDRIDRPQKPFSVSGSDKPEKSGERRHSQQLDLQSQSFQMTGTHHRHQNPKREKLAPRFNIAPKKTPSHHISTRGTRFCFIISIRWRRSASRIYQYQYLPQDCNFFQTAKQS